ncbi:unnamed protein product [Paramecium sonneborni]|uniref:Uncharacterized protein n=1 Tax=Paramecium sonneborni TaxID=65129 RepID=A0A8S1RPC5_9CILI|nr:unnamed protein product [Paramecium sonneborni]
MNFQNRYPFIGKSKHYAFIYFSSQEEACKAKKEPMHITYIQEYKKDANLLFNCFELTVTLKQLEEFFQLLIQSYLLMKLKKLRLRMVLIDIKMLKNKEHLVQLKKRILQVLVGWMGLNQKRQKIIYLQNMYADHLSRMLLKKLLQLLSKECGYGNIQLIRLEKMQQGFQQIIRIGYFVFVQASYTNKLVKNFKEIKNLFDPNVETACVNTFNIFFLNNQQSQQRGHLIEDCILGHPALVLKECHILLIKCMKNVRQWRNEKIFPIINSRISLTFQAKYTSLVQKPDIQQQISPQVLPFNKSQVQLI